MISFRTSPMFKKNIIINFFISNSTQFSIKVSLFIMNTEQFLFSTLDILELSFTKNLNSKFLLNSCCAGSPESSLPIRSIFSQMQTLKIK